MVLLLSIGFTMESAAIEKAKTIVIFFALHANLPAYQNLLEGFSTTF